MLQPSSSSLQEISRAENHRAIGIYFRMEIKSSLTEMDEKF